MPRWISRYIAHICFQIDRLSSDKLSLLSGNLMQAVAFYRIIALLPPAWLRRLSSPPENESELITNKHTLLSWPDSSRRIWPIKG
jgi:hypothetical protein